MLIMNCLASFAMMELCRAMIHGVVSKEEYLNIVAHTPGIGEA